MITVRIWFEKRGEASYISLLDLQRVMQRALRRSGLPVWYTQGFNPHIYLTFACPLALGQESICENCDVKSEQETIDCEQWARQLAPTLPAGLRVIRVALAQQKPGEIAFADYEVRIPEAFADALEQYNCCETAPVVKKTKSGPKQIDFKAYLPRIEYQIEGQDAVFRLRLPAGSAVNLNPAPLLTFLQQNSGLPVWECHSLRLCLLGQDGTPFA